MGSGPPCDKHRPNSAEAKELHVVTALRCNYSAFNGHHYTPSDYSEIRCLDTGTVWRTKAAYVDDLQVMDADAAHTVFVEGRRRRT